MHVQTGMCANRCAQRCGGGAWDEGVFHNRSWDVQLLREGDLKLGSIRFFVIDECDKVLDKSGEACLAAEMLCCMSCWEQTSLLHLWEQQLQEHCGWQQLSMVAAQVITLISASLPKDGQSGHRPCGHSKLAMCVWGTEHGTRHCWPCSHTHSSIPFPAEDSHPTLVPACPTGLKKP